MSDKEGLKIVTNGKIIDTIISYNGTPLTCVTKATIVLDVEEAFPKNYSRMSS